MACFLSIRSVVFVSCPNGKVAISVEGGPGTADELLGLAWEKGHLQELQDGSVK